MQPKVYASYEHSIQPESIDRDALYILSKLHQAGFTAYLVGGGVRDLLMGHLPKDYDISTSAKPEELRRLFSNCLLIGRRFRLAHIRFGKKIFEVSTFRSGETTSELIIRDNTWGTPEEDVLRRDFTINGLFYDPVDNKIIDFVNGCEDLSKHLLRTIGTPDTRFKQDPVRMIRLLKFRARFGFDIDAETWNALCRCQEEILKSSPARILEEIFKMLESGASEPFFRLMTECGFIQLLFPKLHHFLTGDQKENLYVHLAAADALIKKEKSHLPDRSVLVCSLLFPLLEASVLSHHTSDASVLPFGQIVELTHHLLNDIDASSFPVFPRRVKTMVDFILHTQYRLTPLSSKHPHRYRIMRHPDFTHALAFLRLRSLARPELQESYLSWKKLHRPHHRGKTPKETLSSSE